MEVVVSTFGCTIIKMIVEDKNGVKGDVVLGYDDFNQYQTLDGYLGALVGRVANRIGKGTFELNGETYHLPINNGPNSLHGGIRGFSYQIFDYEILDDYTIKFTYHAKDGEEGYPGNMDFSATYHLEGTTLTISYHATSDKDTLINITNHSYFNLSGHKHNIYNHTLKIDADYYEHVDADGLATGEKEAVEGTPFDFRIPAKIGERVEVDHPQLKLGNGFDHNFFFTTDKNQVVLEDEESGRRLTVSTTLPGAQIYTANYLDGRIGKNGEPYNVYTDGLKIFTTIDSRMQKYAEEAVLKHVGNYLQPAFTKENRTKPNAPFTNALTAAEVKGILNRSIRQSERYRAMKEQGATESEIQKAFRTPVEMSVFTYHGDIDTVMTPLDSIRYIKSFLRSGFVSMDPHNGAVKAYVGGVDFTHFTYDMATQGRRQVGSTIKPFLYALSMSNGMSPCDVAPNVQRSYGNWTPRNGSRSRYGQMVTLKWGLAQSNNWISAYLMSRINPQDFLRILRDFGINTYGVYPSIVLCLGPNEASVCEMVSAYTTFANHGIHCSPMFVSKIEDNEGNVIATFQPRMNEVISEESAYKMLEMLKAVMDGGTGSRMRYKYKVECDMGGKTGTTNRNADAWFMGFTPSLVSGCWVGGEDRDIHFDSTRMGQGANMALPIWAYYMKKVFADRSLGYDPNEKFDIPEDFNPCVSEFDDYSAGGIEEVFE